MLRHRIIQVLFFLFLCFSLNSQTYHFVHYSVKEGLAQSDVTAIIQDQSGYYWVATEGGLSRFDGKNFINYTIEDGLADNNVTALFQDKSGRIWLGHDNGALTIYENGQFKALKSKVLAKGRKVNAFFQDSQGSLWISTFASGVLRIMDPSKKVEEKLQMRTYTSKDGLSQMVLNAYEDKQGDVLFLTDVGLRIYKSRSRSFEIFRAENMPIGQIICLTQNKDKEILIGTSAGFVSRYNSEKKEFETIIDPRPVLRYSNNSGMPFVFAIHQDSKGNVWASGSDHGVFMFDKKSGKTKLFNTSNGLAVNKVVHINEDREGNILFGTRGEGFVVFSSERFSSLNKSNGLLNNQVWAITQDQGGALWFGTSEGVSKYDPSKDRDEAFTNFTIENGLTANNVRSLVTDRSGNVWAGTWGGKIVKYEKSANRFVQVGALNDIVNNLVSCLMIDRRNNLWIGTVEGIVRYSLDNGSIKTFRTIDGLSENDISCLFEDSNGKIWIGTQHKGISIYDGKSLRILSREEGLTYGRISSIAEDRSKRIWIGTEGGGAFVYNGKSFTNYRMKNGLVSDFISLIAVDSKNQIWLGTNRGISKYLPDKESFYTYGSGDGFTGAETKSRAVYMDKAANLWFGTVNGVYRYNPDKDIPVSQEPMCKLLRMKVNLDEVPLQDKLELSYKENSLAFDYIGISLSNPEGVQYRIQLEGYDEDWKAPAKQSSQEYSNLSPGTYKFKVISCNASGVCNAEPVTQLIVITPPYWKTWWFYLLVFAIISGALFAYIKVRERSLIREKSILEEKVNERTAEVVQKNRELDEINKDITASIRYAKRIQDAILPPDEYVRTHLPNTFVLFKPKDIVSGDFYFMADKGEHVIFAAVDCTGHGVPGAFMSIVGHNLLERIVGEHGLTKPAAILDELNRSISETLRQTDLEDNTVRDGMDIALCTYNRKTSVLQFAGAFNPLWLIRDKELIEIKADKFPIGNTKLNDNNSFKNHEISLRKGDTIYVFSDGYCDQFGGPNGKKFKASNLKQLLLRSQHLSMDEQYALLNQSIEEWRGNHEQVDDILVIGTRYTGN